MDLLKFSWVDYTLFCLMFGFSAIIGVYYGCFGNKQSTTKDYLYGGKNMKVIPVGISMVASTLSGISLLGIPGDVYMYGTQFWITVVGAILMGFINNYIYLPVFYKLQLTSTYQYLDMRFDKHVSKFASFLFAISTFLYLPIVIYAPALAFNQMTGLNINYIAPVMTLICIFYTTIGGLKTVIWTDTLQFTVTLITLGFVIIVGTISVGGVSVIWDKAQIGNRIEFFNLNVDPTVRATFWSVALGQTFLWISYGGIHPAGVQRFLATPSLKDAKKALTLFIILTVITKSISCFSGLIMYAKYFDCDPLSTGQIKRADQILPYYVMDVANQIPGLSGLFIAGICSTALSTLSTYLNSLSGIIYTDYILPFRSEKASENNSSNLIKIITVIIGISSLSLVFVVEKLGSIIEMWISLNGITSGTLVGLFTLGMVFPFAQSTGALVGGVGSLLFMTWMIIETKILVKDGKIKYQPKPLNVYGCNITSFNQTLVPSTLHTVICEPEKPFWLFRVTFHYYTLIGALVTIIIGLGISWVVRKTRRDVKAELLSPLVHRFISNSTRNVEYESVNKHDIKDVAEITLNNLDN